MTDTTNAQYRHQPLPRTFTAFADCNSSIMATKHEQSLIRVIADLVGDDDVAEVILDEELINTALGQHVCTKLREVGLCATALVPNPASSVWARAPRNSQEGLLAEAMLVEPRLLRVLASITTASAWFPSQAVFRLCVYMLMAAAATTIDTKPVLCELKRLWTDPDRCAGLRWQRPVTTKYFRVFMHHLLCLYNGHALTTTRAYVPLVDAYTVDVYMATTKVQAASVLLNMSDLRNMDLIDCGWLHTVHSCDRPPIGAAKQVLLDLLWAMVWHQPGFDLQQLVLCIGCTPDARDTEPKTGGMQCRLKYLYDFVQTLNRDEWQQLLQSVDRGKEGCAAWALFHLRDTFVHARANHLLIMLDNFVDACAWLQDWDRFIVRGYTTLPVSASISLMHPLPPLQGNSHEQVQENTRQAFDRACLSGDGSAIINREEIAQHQRWTLRRTLVCLRVYRHFYQETHERVVLPQPRPTKQACQWRYTHPTRALPQ